MSGTPFRRTYPAQEQEETPRLADCNRCGEVGLSWRQVKGKWRLFRGETQHNCLQECKYCGQEGFRWGETPKGWRLVSESGKVHLCQAKRPGGGMPQVDGRPDGMPF